MLVINKNYTEMHGQRNIKFYRNIFAYSKYNLCQETL